MSFYVYSRHLKSGREDCCKICDTVESAIEHIRRCYDIDKDINQLGEYYYFMKRH